MVASVRDGEGEREEGGGLRGEGRKGEGGGMREKEFVAGILKPSKR